MSTLPTVETLEAPAVTIEALYAHYHATLMQRAYAILHNREDAEDAVQHTFVKAWQALPTLDTSHGLSGWLYRVVSNAALDIARKRRTTQARTACSLAELPFEIEDTGQPDPCVVCTQNEDAWQTLRRLPDMVQHTLVLYVLMGYTARQVMVKQGKSPNSAGPALRQARTAFTRAYHEVQTQATHTTKTAKGDITHEQLAV